MRIIALPGRGMRSLNPYCHLLYSNMDAEVVDFGRSTVFQGHYDVCHLHWPESDLNTSGWFPAFIRLVKKLLIIDLLRLRGTKIVWTVHNLKSHEQRHPRLESWYWKRFTARLSGFIALTEVGLAAAKQKFPALRKIPGFVVPHGHYRGEYPNGPASRAKERLGISPDITVVLFFGQIRPYKGIDDLIRVFRDLRNESVELWIVGDPRFPHYAEELKELSGDDKRIHLDFRFVAAEDVQLYFGIADLVALPYKDILNSGSAMLALSFDRPVLVPKLGAMEELSRKVGPDWMKPYSGDLNADVLEEALSWATSSPREGGAPLQAFEWKKLGADTLAGFKEICLRTTRI